MSRIEVFKQMLESDPTNTMVMFGLANEYLKAEDFASAIPALQNYLAQADDEGAAWGMLAKAFEKTNRRDEAKNAYKQGVAAAYKHGHPSMAAEFEETLEFDYAD